MIQFLFDLDKSIFLFFNAKIANPVFDFIFPIITEPDNWLIPAILGLGVFIYFEKKQALLILFLGLITFALTDAISYRIIKPLVGRLRPCNPEVLIRGGNFLMGYKSSFSFPSNHAANMFGIATVFYYFYKDKAIFFFGFAGIIGFSRIYVGVHYPSDVLGGTILGLFLGSVVFSSYKLIKNFSYRIRQDKGETAST
ncbi:MAG: phosphatase PAP2 family protein [Candidatus Cloacimonetes bacterium]|nr:phosphatase PAP2 family protein [Candidatus Cloacimonadota bacterium]MBS3766739.1 phosphatase PAP2 family protein [Candidatus Cloacimonadota bacterium]